MEYRLARGFVLSILFSGLIVLAEDRYKISLGDTSCGGFPRLPVRSFRGSCLGLVADSTLKDDRGNGFRFPRKIIELEPYRFLVSDLGGWVRGRGILWELDLREGKKILVKRLSGLDMPHDLQVGPDGDIFLGERGKILRISRQSLINGEFLRPETVVGPLPSVTNARYLHPLNKFAFGVTDADRNDLYVNIGTSTDSCVKEAPRSCSESNTLGVLRRYKYVPSENKWDPKFTVWARGLRNSMGLVFHSSGSLLQVENSRDIKSENEPYDELNLILPNQNYGWPYCYNFLASSPEWKRDCRLYQLPLFLLPPHVAPLDLLYYEGSLFPEMKNHLLMSWHGYQPTGSRVVAYPTNDQGLPIENKDSFSWSYNIWHRGQVESRKAQPQGGLLRSASYVEIVSGWSEKAGVRPAGAPVGLTVASDGSIWMVEDKNKSVVILTSSENSPYEDEEESSETKKELDRAKQKLISNQGLQRQFTRINQQILQVSCAGCHGGLKGSPDNTLDFLVRSHWVTPGQTNSRILLRLRGTEGLQKMPLGSSLPEASIQMVETWIRDSN